MNKLFKYFKYLFYAVFVAAAVFAGFLAFMTLNDYVPPKQEKVICDAKASVIEVGKPLTCMIWNIGYAGLDAGMDFFYDGGTQMRPTHHQSYSNLKNIESFVLNHPVDFLMLQEIDTKAKRSYGMNQVDTIANALGLPSYFGKNYSVKWVPLPVLTPMGNVESGIAVYTKQQPTGYTRYAYPVNFEWPLKVFMLDRCFLELRFPTANGHELVLVNTHNSAFDDGGELRKAELDYFKDYMLNEYKKGNYVIAGGDFNQCPAHYVPAADNKLFDREDFHTVPDTLLPADWHFVFDASVPSNRRVVAPYDAHTTKTTLIDFFITSPNVTTQSVETKNLKFENSDHNPVLATFVLR